MALFKVLAPTDPLVALAATAKPAEERVNYDELANAYNTLEVGGVIGVNFAKKHISKVATCFTQRGLNRNADFTLAGVSSGGVESIVVTRLTSANAVNAVKVPKPRKPVAPPIPAEDGLEAE